MKMHGTIFQITHIVPQTSETANESQSVMRHHNHRAVLFEKNRRNKIPTLKDYDDRIDVICLPEQYVLRIDNIAKESSLRRLRQSSRRTFGNKECVKTEQPQRRQVEQGYQLKRKQISPIARRVVLGTVFGIGPELWRKDMVRDEVEYGIE